MAHEPEEPSEWCELAVYPDNAAAEVDAGYLRSEGVPAAVIVVDNFPGHGRSRLMVESAQEERARWLLQFPPVSDNELEFLATGELPNPDLEK